MLVLISGFEELKAISIVKYLKRISLSDYDLLKVLKYALRICNCFCNFKLVFQSY